jgi:uncharacterized protein (TIGR02594 family)
MVQTLCLNNPLRYTDPSGDNPALIGIGIYAAFAYLKGAYDNRNMTTGKWAWNPVSWFGKNKTGFVAGINTNTDFTSVNYYAGLYSPDYSPVLSYNPNYGLGVGDVTNTGSSAFYYPSYNPPSAESVVNMSISNAKKPQGQKGTPWMNTALEEYKANVKEAPMGSNSGPRVDVYLNYAGVSSPNAWCGAYVNWCLGQNGIEGAGAKGNSYLNWGIKVDNPVYGAVTIFKTGHVGFYMDTNSDGTLKILHGNWSNRVKISSGVYDPIYPSQIRQYRMPQR